MRIATMFTTAAFAALFSVSAMAQTATPSTTTTTPSATTSTPAMKSTTSTVKPKAMKPAQTSVSKACSAQADAKGLHGKARAKFRSDCKKNGGKAA
ncbi:MULTISPECIES: PsiF family protein [Rhizobium]|uniref:PsiF repeat-containing protein n=1 Tax=Rhizobium lusitanum TaxID=293958 RepID=A0A1C3VGE8_9HYPH|nr:MULTISPECIES: PsiF family protein [Rhizobium]NKJ05587.1 carbohydrate-binding DOMON domain-containing protein [Rhizobium sp. SG741]NRP85586.1 hypothetical protein [Ensifer adhaerens]NTJ07056.1 hypothetical protein [Rhizobium lusitanum]SCB26866.1 psiF repeat-containing protein [Rhizobium lusitanum]